MPQGHRYHGFVVDGNGAGTTSWAVDQPATALRRAHIDEINASSSATVVDQTAEWRLVRTSAGGTNSTRVANPLDPDAVVASVLFHHTHSVDPTITANSELLQVAVHMRNTYRWVAPPRGEFILPITDVNGLANDFTTVTAAFNVTFSVYFWE